MILRQPSSLTQEVRALRVAIRRADIIFAAQFAALNGHSKAAVMRARKVSAPSLWRWQKRWQRHGFAGLMPRKSPGRSPKSNAANAVPPAPAPRPSRGFLG